MKKSHEIGNKNETTRKMWKSLLCMAQIKMYGMLQICNKQDKTMFSE